MNAGRIIVQHIPGCRFCPNRRYYSGGIYECFHLQFADRGVRLQPEMDWSNEVPAWCPLDKQPGSEEGK